MDLGRAVLFAGSALLFVSLFIEWYDVGLTGWQVFETLDLVLAALAIAGLVAAVRPDLAPPWAGIVVPGAAVLVVFVQLVDNPPAAGDASPSAGAWLALAGAFLMAAGSALSLAAISVTVQFQERDVRRRVVAVDRRAGRDREAAVAEDLDADAGAEAPPAAGKTPSLFAGLGRRGTEEGDAGDDDPPPRRFAPRETPAAPTPPGPEGADVERTQPLASVPDDEEDAERP